MGGAFTVARQYCPVGAGRTFRPAMAPGNGNGRTAAQTQKKRPRQLEAIRFADDFVITMSGQRHHAEALREEAAAVLAPLGLRLAPEKTRVVHIDEGFDFLGLHIRRQRKRGTQKHDVSPEPFCKAIQAIKDKVKAKTYRSTRHMAPDELITSLNRLLAGWANYFRYGVSKAVFGAIDSLAWGRIMRWLRAKYNADATRSG